MADAGLLYRRTGRDEQKREAKKYKKKEKGGVYTDTELVLICADFNS
jgi:hypothetical protein